MSTLLQVFISIQALIMVEDPYFNEPGYEGQMGTPAGNVASAAYNDTIRVQTLRLAMTGMLRNPPRGFEAVVRTHFAVLGPAIVEQCVA
jgi:baculoviral IAP repeat-containing protein 6